MKDEEGRKINGRRKTYICIPTPAFKGRSGKNDGRKMFFFCRKKKKKSWITDAYKKRASSLARQTRERKNDDGQELFLERAQLRPQIRILGLHRVELVQQRDPLRLFRRPHHLDFLLGFTERFLAFVQLTLELLPNDLGG